MRRVPEATGDEAPKVEGQVGGMSSGQGTQPPGQLPPPLPRCVGAKSCPPGGRELTENNHRKLRKLPGISWPGRKAVGGSKIVSQMEKLRFREVSGSPYSELTGW